MLARQRLTLLLCWTTYTNFVQGSSGNPGLAYGSFSNVHTDHHAAHTGGELGCSHIDMNI